MQNEGMEGGSSSEGPLAKDPDSILSLYVCVYLNNKYLSNNNKKYRLRGKESLGHR